MSFVIVIANQKGGTGKTPLAVNTAAGIARRGVKTLLVDADPQATATQWFEKNPDNFDFDMLSTQKAGLPVDEVIKQTMEEYQIVVVDTPAGGGEGALDDKSNRRLVRLSSLYVVPTKPTPGSLRSTIGFVRRLQGIRDFEQLTNSLNIMLLWVQAQSRTVIMRDIIKSFEAEGGIDGVYIAKTVLQNRIGYDDADGWGTSIFGLEEKIKSNRILQQEFYAYIDEVEDLLAAEPVVADSVEMISEEAH